MSEPKRVTITNIGACDRVFPSGDVVAVNASGSVPADDLEHPVVKAWLVEGAIKEGEVVAKEPTEAGSDADAVKGVATEAAKAAKGAKKSEVNA